MYNESLKKLVIFSGIHLLSSGAFHRSELGGLHPLSFQVVCILSSGIPIDLYFPLVAFRGPEPIPTEAWGRSGRVSEPNTQWNRQS